MIGDIIFPVDQTAEDNRLGFVVQNSGQPYFYTPSEVAGGLTVPMLVQMYIQNVVRRKSEMDQHNVLTLDYLEGRCTNAYLMDRSRRKMCLTSTIPFPEYQESLERGERDGEDRDIHGKVVGAMSFTATAMTALAGGDMAKAMVHAFDAFTILMEAHQLIARKRTKGLLERNVRVDYASKNLPRRQRRGVGDIFGEGPAGGQELVPPQPQPGTTDVATRGGGGPAPQDPQGGTGTYANLQGGREPGGGTELNLNALRHAIWQTVQQHPPLPYPPPPYLPRWQRGGQGRFRAPRGQPRVYAFPQRGGSAVTPK
jgi:hypothetical protein